MQPQVQVNAIPILVCRNTFKVFSPNAPALLAAVPREVPLDTYRNIGIMAHIDAGKVRPECSLFASNPYIHTSIHDSLTSDSAFQLEQYCVWSVVHIVCSQLLAYASWTLSLEAYKSCQRITVMLV